MYFFKLVPCLILVLLLSCNNDNSIDPISTGNIARPDTNGNIQALIGDTIEIKILNSSYDGGYSWKIINEFSPSTARFINYKTIYTGEYHIMGAPTFEIWRYYALSEGKIQLTMNLDRSFEQNSVISTRTYILNVTKK